MAAFVGLFFTGIISDVTLTQQPDYEAQRMSLLLEVSCSSNEVFRNVAG